MSSGNPLAYLRQRAQDELDALFLEQVTDEDRPLRVHQLRRAHVRPDGDDSLRPEDTAVATSGLDPARDVPGLVAALDAQAVEAVVDIVEQPAREPPRNEIDRPEDDAP